MIGGAFSGVNEFCFTIDVAVKMSISYLSSEYGILMSGTGRGSSPAPEIAPAQDDNSLSITESTTGGGGGYFPSLLRLRPTILAQAFQHLPRLLLGHLLPGVHHVVQETHPGQRGGQARSN